MLEKYNTLIMYTTSIPTYLITTCWWPTSTGCLNLMLTPGLLSSLSRYSFGPGLRSLDPGSGFFSDREKAGAEVRITVSPRHASYAPGPGSLALVSCRAGRGRWVGRQAPGMCM